MREQHTIINDTAITAVHAGALARKILQLLSGAVYDEHGNVVRTHSERYDLVVELMRQRNAGVVGYNWQHEVDAIVPLATKAGLKVAVINGKTPAHLRPDIVKRFQNGDLDWIIAHPKAAGHGLTLTRGTTTLWASPTYNSEQWTQLNHRIYRARQTKKTETIGLAYADSKETDVFDALRGKLDAQASTLNLFTLLTKAA